MDIEFFKNLKKKLDSEKTEEGFDDKLKDFVNEQNKIHEDAEKVSKNLKDKFNNSIENIENALSDARKEHKYDEKPSDEEMEKANDFAQLQLAEIEVQDAKAKYDLAVEVYDRIKEEFESKHGKIKK